MNDLLPERSPLWQYFEGQIRTLMQQYGYLEIRTPMLEQTALFSRSIGEVTDIVEKEMYTFDDRNGDSLSLRPEGTAAIVRAAIENGLLHHQTQRLWYAGPMFRHERPQKGRYRQFHQVGVETFGLEGPDIDAEVIALSARLWQALGLREHVRLEINSLGSLEARHAYRAKLVAYFNHHLDELDDDARRRLDSNPLRILDSKNPDMQGLIEAAPRLIDHLDDDSVAHFEGLKRRLEALGIDYVVNPRLVRGLDYYSRTVFEWTTTALGSQGTVCAGGRYDGLVEQLGGRPTPAVGFAMGVERLILLLETLDLMPAAAEDVLDVYLMGQGEDIDLHLLKMAETLRSRLPSLRVQVHCGGGSLKSQFKRADRSHARFAAVVGEQELADGVVALKDLRGDDPQQLLDSDALVARLAQWIEARPAAL